jgi:hypothetical protein
MIVLGVFAIFQMSKMNANALIMRSELVPSISDIGDINVLVAKYQGLQSEHQQPAGVERGDRGGACG